MPELDLVIDNEGLERLKEILAEENDESIFLRIVASPG